MGVILEKYINSSNRQGILSAFSYKLFLIIFLLSIIKINAQSYSGKVDNDSKKPLAGAIITLSNLETDETIDYAITDDEGFFLININKNGNYKLNINAIGYHKIEKNINIIGDIKINYTLTEEKEQKIEEVILTSTKPIKIKSDTIEMNAKSFMNGTEKNVEDLLKKLPGITVENDGKIKIQGKEIEKVMVENDDFFERGYTLLTKNMSVKPIEKVQILQSYSNNKLLKGVENSDKVAINLTLADDAKRDWFGSADLSSSFFPESFYSEKINLTKFGKRAKYFLLGSINNVGSNTIGNLDHLIKPSTQDEPGFINIETDVYKFGAESFIYLPLGSEKAKFNNDKIISANAIFNLNDKMKVKIVSLGNFEKLNFNKTSVTDFDFGTTQFTNTEEFFRQNKKTNYFNKIDFEYDISQKTTLKYSGNINYWTYNKNESLIFNKLPWNTNQNTQNHSTDNHILLTNKKNDKLVWLNSIRYLNQSIKDYNLSNQFFFDDLFIEHQELTNFNQDSRSKIQFLGLLSQILYRSENNNLWNFSISNYNTVQTFRNKMRTENGSFIYFLGENYRNDVINRNNNLALSLKQVSSFGRFKINPQLDIHYVKNEFENKDNDVKNEDFFLIVPNLNINWAIHNKGRLSSSAFLSQNSTTIIDMLPNYFSDSPRSLMRGSNDFEYLKNTGATLKYTYGNWNDRIFFNLSGSYTKYHNYLSYNYNIQQQYTISDLIFLKNRKDYLFSSEFNYYLRTIKSNFKVIYTMSTSQYEDQIEQNNFRNVLSSYNLIGFQLKSAWKKILDFRIGTSLNFSKIKTDLQESKVINQDSFVELNFTLNEKTKLEVKNKYFSFDGFFSNENSYNFLDFKLKYLYDKNISFSLIGNNLFNTKKFKQIYLTSYSRYVSEYSLFPRYLMLEMSFGL